MLQVVFIVSSFSDYRLCLLCSYRSSTENFPFHRGGTKSTPWWNDLILVDFLLLFNICVL